MDDVFYAGDLVQYECAKKDFLNFFSKVIRPVSIGKYSLFFSNFPPFIYRANQQRDQAQKIRARENTE
jgi:hypothetical protein